MDTQFYYSQSSVTIERMNALLSSNFSAVAWQDQVLELHVMIEVGVASSGYYSDGKGSIVE
jgi:hypothetical protein